MTLSRAAVEQALSQIQDPAGHALTSNERIESLVIDGATIRLTLRIAAAEAKAFADVQKAAEAALLALPGITRALVILTAEKTASAPRAQGSARDIPGVRHMVAVASGKGGVGKSTLAANLALALRRKGLAVGLVDADIYGPSVPRLMGVSRKPEFIDGKMLKPIEAHGLKVMSIGFMVEEESPLIWRGPMIDSALTQMMREVAWGDLDVLIVDMPPGTGDAQLTMAQKMPLDGAIIVSTPQDLALIDARKGLTLFAKADVKVFGLVENMSTFICPACGSRCDIFGHGGAQREAEKLGLDFLGEIPLHMAIRVAADAGAPSVVADPDGPHAAAYGAVAERLWAKLAARI